MCNVHRFLSFVLALVAVLSLALAAPAAAQGDEEVRAVPAGPSWDETSGYGAVEASRAARAEAAISASWDETSGYASVEATRAAIGQDTSWDETSGNGAVETSRAAGCDVTRSDVGAALAAGTRAESAHLATIPLPGECD
jgi:hypothetical protein